ncbi:DUF3048 domain-containing protein [Bacillus sp. 1NLA3E]|uniref:DUF3048 domain-containing protein n=1 Tax=Bacillus sp. 1NLA3E TaxID=666686 RepID=UPI000247EB2B|nr:DUF3048 domain-containing protein [Bacillus sp. 1NLA3E]
MVRRYIVVSAAIFLLLTGCSGTKEANVKEHKEKAIENVQKETAEFPNYFPLTGIGTKEEVGGRAVAVMVNNHPKARPQTGLDKADIVYELLAEGNVTRFLAIFQSEKPEKIGPVRSAREYYIKLAKAYDSLYIAHGYSPDAKEMLDNGYIDNLNGMQYDGTLFKRSTDRVAPHNSYITYEKILEGAEKNSFSMKNAPEPLTFLTKDEIKKLEGQPGKKVSVAYLNNPTFTATYEYDETIGKYKRFSAGEQTVNYETDAPVLLDNVFIVETEHQTLNDGAGRRKIDLTSGGKAYLLQKGFLRQVEWKSQDGRIVPVINGAIVGFVPGKTWINIVPSNPGLTSEVKVEAN